MTMLSSVISGHRRHHYYRLQYQQQQRHIVVCLLSLIVSLQGTIESFIIIHHHQPLRLVVGRSSFSSSSITTRNKHFAVHVEEEVEDITVDIPDIFVYDNDNNQQQLMSTTTTSTATNDDDDGDQTFVITSSSSSSSSIKKALEFVTLMKKYRIISTTTKALEEGKSAVDDDGNDTSTTTLRRQRQQQKQNHAATAVSSSQREVDFSDYDDRNGSNNELVLQMIREIKNDINDMKSNLAETNQKYDNLESRLIVTEEDKKAKTNVLESSSKTIVAKKPGTVSAIGSSISSGSTPSPTSTHVMEEGRATQAASAASSKVEFTGWFPLEPDPQEPFCSLSGSFLWLGSDHEVKLLATKLTKTASEATKHASSSSSSPAMIATTMGRNDCNINSRDIAAVANMGEREDKSNNKIEIIIENQCEISNQLQFVMSQLKSISEVQQQHTEILDGIINQGKSNNDNVLLVMETMKNTMDDVSNVKHTIQDSISKYHQLKEHLNSVVVETSSSSPTERTGSDSSSEVNTVTRSRKERGPQQNIGDKSIGGAVSMKIETSNEEKMFASMTDRKLPPPFCSFEGNFFWIAADKR